MVDLPLQELATLFAGFGACVRSGSILRASFRLDFGFGFGFCFGFGFAEAIQRLTRTEAGEGEGRGKLYTLSLRCVLGSARTAAITSPSTSTHTHTRSRSSQVSSSTLVPAVVSINANCRRLIYDAMTPIRQVIACGWETHHF